METLREHGMPPVAGAPSHVLPRKFVEPMLYLAEKIANQGSVLHGGAMKDAKAMLRDLAKAAGAADYAAHPSFRQLDERKACEMLDMEAAKRGALVLLALMLKAGPEAGEAHRKFFTRIRTALGADQVKVPVGMDEHWRLALSFLGR